MCACSALSYANNFKWKESKGEDRYRRGMYTFFKRTSPYPDLMTFDCPDANVASVRRTVSNTPLHKNYARNCLLARRLVWPAPRKLSQML